MDGWKEIFTEESAKRGLRFTDDDLHALFSDNAQEYLNMDVPMPPGRI